jgi:transposase-like protein
MGKTRNKFALEVRERADWLVLDAEGPQLSRWQAVLSISTRIGCARQTLRAWFQTAEVHGGGAGIPTETAERKKVPEGENRKLRQANDAIRKGEHWRRNRFARTGERASRDGGDRLLIEVTLSFVDVNGDARGVGPNAPR